jgi:hypothetical protein
VQPSSVEGVESLPAPSSQTEKHTEEYNLPLHVKEVIDRGPFMMEGTGFYLDEDEDLQAQV